MSAKKFSFVKVSKLEYGLVESVRFRHDSGEISWVDIENGTLSWLEKPARNTEKRLHLKPQLSFAEPLKDLSYVFAAGTRIGVADRQGVVGISAPLLSPGRRFNDGVIDSLGRLVLGSMNIGESDTKNVLLVLENSGEITVLDSDLGLSNGLAVVPESGDLFSVDTLRRVVYRRSLDHKSSKYGPRHVFTSFKPGENPDGIAYSLTGHLVVALWGGSVVVILDNEGFEIQRILVPPVFVTSVCIHPGTGALVVGGASQPRGSVEVSPESGGVWWADSRLEGYPGSTWLPPEEGRLLVDPQWEKVIV